MPVVSWFARRVVVVVTATIVGDIAKTIEDLPGDFDPVEWLDQNQQDISIVATEAIRDIVWEALKIGLADHPLVQQRSRLLPLRRRGRRVRCYLPQRAWR
jgi:hypothetical protein